MLGPLQDVLDFFSSLIPDWKGPPKDDAVMLFKNGQLIMQGLMDGMLDEWLYVKKWLRTLDASTAMSLGGVNAAFGNDGNMGMGPIQITVNINGPVDNPQAVGHEVGTVAGRAFLQTVRARGRG
jgi:hypothetical protein